MTVKMWVIGGRYFDKQGHQLTFAGFWVRSAQGENDFAAFEHEGNCPVLVRAGEVSGPTHVPCPICGELKQVSTDGLQIDLAEHLMRHHPSEWKKQQEAEQPSSGDPGEGWRLLEMNETVKAGDHIKALREPCEWVMAGFSVGQFVEDCPGYEFRRRVEPHSEAAATPDCRVDPGAGYRLLGKQEALREGDEFLVEGVWLLSSNILQGGDQSHGITYRRKLKHPPGPGVGFRFVDPGESRKDSDEIWSFVDEQWKPIEHMWCNEFKGLPVVRRRRVEQEEVENKQEVKPADRKMQQNCVFFTFSGESFSILLTPDGKVSLHRCVPFAGLAMIVERESIFQILHNTRNCLCEVLLKSGIRLPTVEKIVAGVCSDVFSKDFVEAAESAWIGVYGPF